MTDDPLYIGSVWTGGSWIAVAFDSTGFDHGAVFDSIGDCWLNYEERTERILVDVPIGLREGGDGERRCDELARSVLGPRSDAVFTPPVREATRRRRYPAAKRVHERKSGTELTETAFAHSEPIAAVDELVRELPEARAVVAESHPELCFRAFAGEQLSYPIEIAGGYAERMRVLADFDRDAPPTVQSAAEEMDGNEVTVHDVLDAVALGYTARPGPGSIRTLPAEPPADPTGLPMRMTYRSTRPLTAE